MSRKKTLLLSLLLTLPVIVFLIHHYTFHSPALQPTGFTADENVLYMSYAHQYIDQENFSLCYSNPFDGNPQSPTIYFQPVNFLFAPLLKLGLDPGLVFSLFGLVMAFCCIYFAVRIIQHILPDSKYQVLVAVLFTWGGGLTAIAGLGSSVVSGTPLSSWIDGIYLADPANGWWGMNWGRTLFIPLEAYYHFLFFLNIYLLLKEKWIAAIFITAFLSISHPFTGIEHLLIIFGWLLLEKLIFKTKAIPNWFLLSIVVVTAFHIWYYLIYLSSFAEHRQLFSQYSAGWTYSFRVFIPAYSLVFLLAALTLYINKTVPKFLSLYYQRLFICWAIVAFLLSKHEWFIKPMQPIHFTRGYVWAGLFLLGVPGLAWLLEQAKKTTWKKIALAGLVILFLADNALWIGNHLRQKNEVEWEGYITKDTKAVFNFLERNSSRSDLIIGNAPLINYMANVYSPANSWVSHPYNTPNRQERLNSMLQFLTTGVKIPAWGQRRVLLVLNKKDESTVIHPSIKINKLFENESYIIFTP